MVNGMVYHWVQPSETVVECRAMGGAKKMFWGTGFSILIPLHPMIFHQIRIIPLVNPICVSPSGIISHCLPLYPHYIPFDSWNYWAMITIGYMIDIFRNNYENYYYYYIGDNYHNGHHGSSNYYGPIQHPNRSSIPSRPRRLVDTKAEAEASKCVAARDVQEVTSRWGKRQSMKFLLVDYWWLLDVISGWLVVWLPFFYFPYIGNNHPNWLIFFRGVQTANQVVISAYFYVNVSGW